MMVHIKLDLESLEVSLVDIVSLQRFQSTLAKFFLRM